MPAVAAAASAREADPGRAVFENASCSPPRAAPEDEAAVFGAKPKLSRTPWPSKKPSSATPAQPAGSRAEESAAAEATARTGAGAEQCAASDASEGPADRRSAGAAEAAAVLGAPAPEATSVLPAPAGTGASTEPAGASAAESAAEAAATAAAIFKPRNRLARTPMAVKPLDRPTGMEVEADERQAAPSSAVEGRAAGSGGSVGQDAPLAREAAAPLEPAAGQPPQAAGLPTAGDRAGLDAIPVADGGHTPSPGDENRAPPEAARASDAGARASRESEVQLRQRDLELAETKERLAEVQAQLSEKATELQTVSSQLQEANSAASRAEDLSETVDTLHRRRMALGCKCPRGRAFPQIETDVHQLTSLLLLQGMLPCARPSRHRLLVQFALLTRLNPP